MKLYSNLPNSIKQNGITFHFYAAYPTFKTIPSGKKSRIISVLSRNLRGKKDVHGNPYLPNNYLFLEK